MEGYTNVLGVLDARVVAVAQLELRAVECGAARLRRWGLELRAVECGARVVVRLRAEGCGARVVALLELRAVGPHVMRILCAVKDLRLTDSYMQRII